MIKTLIPAVALVFSAMMLTSCDKDAPTPERVIVPPVTVGSIEDPSGTGTPGSASGAVYSVIRYMRQGNYFIKYPGYSLYGWFNNAKFTEDAGKVTFNNKALYKGDSTGTTSWYMREELSSSSDTCNWKITGAATTPAFTDFDTYAYPEITSYQFVDSIKSGESLNIKYTVALSGDASQVVVTASNGTFSLTKVGQMGVDKVVNFTSSELKSMIDAGGQITVKTMPVVFRLKAKEKNKYYFVKQSAYIDNIKIRK